MEQEYNQCQGKLTDLEWKLEKLEDEVKMWKSNFFEIGIRKLPHPKFKREWYTTIMEWLKENYKKNTDTVERNREMVKIMNNLEEILVTKLKTLFHKNDLTSKDIKKMFQKGAIDENQQLEAHNFVLKLEQMYVEKVIQLYVLQPSFFEVSEAEFCEIFEICQ